MDARQTISPTSSVVEPAPSAGAVASYRNTDFIPKAGDAKPVQTPALPAMWADEARHPWLAFSIYAGAILGAMVLSHFWPWGVA